MNMLKIVLLAVVVGMFSGCASNSNRTTDGNPFLKVDVAKDEAKQILINRARTTESLCADRPGILECELLGLSANEPRQFMKFVFVESGEHTKIFITRWAEITDKNGKIKVKNLDLTQEQIDALEEYIEKHRNKQNGSFNS